MKLLHLEYREKALLELKVHFFKLLNKEHHRHVLAFEAPTGSGKTVTMACMLRDIVRELPVHYEIDNREVTYIWIAPNTLHLQSLKSLSHFYSETREIRTMGIDDIDDDCLHPNEMLFLNWQTINRENTLFMRENERGKSFYNILNRTRLNDTQIVVIIDEEHLMAGGTTAEKAEKMLRNIQPKIEIRVSATLSRSSKSAPNRVLIDRADVVKEQMIKKGVHLNPAIKAEDQGARDTDLVLLEAALKKRTELEVAYQATGANVRPLLLIQLPSDVQSLTNEDKKIRDTVVEYLNAVGVSEANGKLAVWLSGEKTNLEDIAKADNMVEALLFKQAIALGWDCPRAGVLLIYRELHSETFTLQTLGRILRMPEQKHYADDALNYGYVYTNLNKDLIQIVPDDADYLSMKRGNRREEIYQNVSLTSYFIQKEIKRNRIGAQFKEALYQAAEELFGVKFLPDSPESHYVQNKAAMEATGVQMDISNIEIRIPTDVNLDGTSLGVVQAAHIEKFAKTVFQLEQLFNRFCISQCGEYQKDGSWERVKYHTEVFFEECLSMMGADVYKIVLHNELRFTDLYNRAREIYAEILKAKGSNKTAEAKKNETAWEVPEFRIYPNDYVEQSSAAHALDPLLARNRGLGGLFDSANETNFIDLLIQNEDLIQWWYKNGSSNREDFAVAYKDIAGNPSLFYVDIVVLFKNGILGLFDPKTVNSDPNNVSKHNALIDYVNNLNAKGQKAIGSIMLPKDGSWRFCRNQISNDHDLTGWEFFNPATI